MAVIREKRQYTAQPIGVVRSDLGGGLVSRSVAQLADTLIQGSYKGLVEDAQQKGVEVAQSVASSNLRTINPETGQPEAFDAPPQFGRAAAKAYQSVVERRYVKETERDLKEASARIYLEEFNKPNGFENYSKRMRDHAETLTDNALPRFQNIVGDMSASLVASTELDFLKTKAKQDLEAQSLGLQEDADSDSATLTSTIASMQIQDEAAIADLAGMIEGMFQAQRDGLTSNVLDATSYSQQENKFVLAIATGLSQSMNATVLRSQTNPDKRALTSQDVKKAQMVVAAGGAGRESLDERLLPYVEFSLGFGVVVRDGEGNEERRDFSTALQSSLEQELTSLSRNLNQIEAAQRADENEDQANDRLSYELQLFDTGLDGGINQTIASVEALIVDGDFEGAVAFMNNFNESIASKGVELDVARDTIIQAQAQVRKGVAKVLADRLYQAIIPVEGEDGIMRSMTVQESELADAYFDGNRGSGALENLPEPVANILRELDAISTPRVRADIQRYVSGKATDVRRNVAADNAAVKQAKTILQLASGTAENNEENRGVLDSKHGVPDVPHYWLSEEGFTRFNSIAREYVSATFVGENLKDTAEYIANGAPEFGEGQINAFFAIYDSLRNESARLGHTVTPWDRTLSTETIAILDAVNAATKNIVGTKSAFEAYSKMMENLSSDRSVAFEDRMQIVTGSKTGSTFVAEVVGENNTAARMYFEPLVKYYVASGLSKDQVTKAIKSTMDRHFRDTEGYVIDPIGGEDLSKSFKSPFAFARFIPSASDRITVVKNINKFLQESGINAYIPRQERTLTEAVPLLGNSVAEMDILDRSDLGIRRDAKKVFLHPVAGSATGSGDDVVYQLVTIDESSGYPMMKVFLPLTQFNMRDIKASLQAEEVPPLPEDVGKGEMLDSFLDSARISP